MLFMKSKVRVVAIPLVKDNYGPFYLCADNGRSMQTGDRSQATVFNNLVDALDCIEDYHRLYEEMVLDQINPNGEYKFNSPKNYSFLFEPEGEILVEVVNWY